MTADILHPGQLAILRAVANGRAEITCSCEPDLYVDGLPCCNQWVVHDLVRSGRLRPARPGELGQRVAATLTASGHRALRALADDPADPAHLPTAAHHRMRAADSYPIAKEIA